MSDPFFIERKFQYFRRVGEICLYEPYLEIMRVGGVLSEKERKELAEAQMELAKAEEEFKNLPVAQRDMMERMMASQMEKLRSMAEDGSVTMEINTSSIEIYPDMSQPLMTAMAMPDGRCGLQHSNWAPSS